MLYSCDKDLVCLETVMGLKVYLKKKIIKKLFFLLPYIDLGDCHFVYLLMPLGIVCLSSIIIINSLVNYKYDY